MASANPSYYRPDIDGLRAVAILAVIFFHADVGLSGGYVGVDVFFVISGFLITRIILKEMDAGEFSLVRFLERRVRRILPAMVCVVLVTILACGVRMLPIDYENLGRSVIAQSLLVANYWFYLVSGYFSPAAVQQPLLHTWSLAVEEQFYLIFPILLAFISRIGIGFVRPTTAVIGIGSFVLSVAWSFSHAWANFYFLPTRAWEMLLGALVATIPLSVFVSQKGREVVAGLGLASILAATFCFGSETRMPGLAALLPCGGAACIIASGLSGQTIVGRLLSLRPLVFIGLISYSLYLWHWPLIALAKYWEFVPVTQFTWLGLLILCFALSILSWKFVELPFRQRRYLPARRQVFGFAAVATLTLLATGIGLVVSNGLPERVPFAARQFAEGINDQVSLTPRAEGVTLQEASEGKWVELGVAPMQPIHLMVWGDSHAMAVLPAIDALCREHQLRGVAAVRAATPPLIDFNHTHPDGLGAEAIPFGEAVIRFSKDHKIRHMILVANWLGSIHPKGDAAVMHGLKSTLSALEKSGCRLWIMPSVPTYNWQVPRMLAYSIIKGKAVSEIGMPFDDYQNVQTRQRKLFSDADVHRVLSILDTLPFFKGVDERCLVQAGGWSLYRDSHHLSARGSQHLKPLFEPIFASIAR